MRSPLPGVKEMLIGPTGTGKTTSIRTLLEAGITPMYMATEPSFEVLGKDLGERIPCKYVQPVAESLDIIIDKATKVASMTFEAMTKVYDANRFRDNKFIEFVKALNDFKCDITGRSYGPAKNWGTDKCLVVDSLSGLSLMVMYMVVGNKPAKDQKDWGLAQDQLEGFVNWLCTSLRCHVVLTAHPEREISETEGSQIMASTLGKKLAPKLPRFFSDVILTQRQGTKFLWSTAAPGADLKARNLPVAEGLQPSFVQVIECWKSRGGLIEKE